MPVRSWALWQRPGRVLIFLLSMEALALGCLVVVFRVAEAPTDTQWLQALVLAVCGTFHIQLTRREQERRRNRSGTVLIDFVGIWVFPAILLLPATVVVALVAILRAQRWFVSRRPAHNFVFSTIAHALAGAAAQLGYAALGPHDWGSMTFGSSFHEFAAILIAAVVYELVQILYVGGALAMRAASPTPSVRTVLGNRADNLIEAVTTGLGAVTAVILVFMPPLVVVMALVSVVFNRFTELGQLQHDVRTDVKTGMLNMRGWGESATRELNRVRHGKGALVLLMADLDNFRWINDTYGHPAGDAALVAMATALDEATRPNDLVARYGGEEFLVLLSDTGTEEALLVADRVRDRIAGLRITTTNKRGESVTITDRTTSVGIAVLGRHGTTLPELIQAADAAVYEAKESGRDRVRVAPTPKEGHAAPRPKEHDEQTCVSCATNRYHIADEWRAKREDGDE